eukprot:6205821-Pleurochrysis_carterae.AAC.1
MSVFAEAVDAVSSEQVYHTLKKILKKKFGGDSTLIGDEGGFAPPCDCRSGLELVRAIAHFLMLASSYSLSRNAARRCPLSVEGWLLIETSRLTSVLLSGKVSTCDLQ